MVFVGVFGLLYDVCDATAFLEIATSVNLNILIYYRNLFGAFIRREGEVSEFLMT